jgi:SAM-dependent methyltransferase
VSKASKPVHAIAKPHSEEQFGPQRDFWWNADFLDLMARRWRLHEAASLADIGCGLCHWSRLLYPYLLHPARFAAVDREPRWIIEAETRFRNAFPEADSEMLTFTQGDATSIPLLDNAFDVVTCQTVLMHLAEPLDALREMLRITRAGGLIVCVEPSNLWNYIPFTSLTPRETTESMIARFDFWLRCHRGRIKAGLGDHNVGDLLPGYFAQLDLRDIAVYQSDQVPALFPPYRSPSQQALIQQQRQWTKSGAGPFDRQELRRLYLLGGGTEEFFDRVFADLVQNRSQEELAIAAGAFHAAYGGITYLVSGRKK